jgi:transposase
VFEESTMSKSRQHYAPEFRRQMVELVQAGRTPEELAREFEPTAQSIRNWGAQAARNAGRGDGGLTTAEREELSRLRRDKPPAPVGTGNPLKGGGLVRSGDERDPTERFQFVSDHHREAIPRREMPRSGIRNSTGFVGIGQTGILLAVGLISLTHSGGTDNGLSQRVG